MASELEQFQNYGALIEKLIRPATFPLAIKLIRSEDDIDTGYKRPLRDLGVQNFICQNFKMSRVYGWTMAVTEADTNCIPARGVYGWNKPSEREMKDFTLGLYAKDAATESKFSQHVHPAPKGTKGLIISPLSRTKIVPDTVLIYCMPAQAMRFVQGYLFTEGGALEFTATGRVGSCHEGVLKAINTNQPQYVTLGNGDRVWGGAHDHEVMFSCPTGKLAILMEGLEKTHEAGLRYPIPQYMNYEPGFQAKFEKAAIERAGGTIKHEKNQ